MTYGISSTFGFHTYHTLPNNIEAHITLNMLNIASWIPLISIASGIVRILDAVKYSNKQAPYTSNSFTVTQILRGACEVLQLTAIFFTLDIFISLGRALCSCYSPHEPAAI